VIATVTKVCSHCESLSIQEGSIHEIAVRRSIHTSRIVTCKLSASSALPLVLLTGQDRSLPVPLWNHFLRFRFECRQRPLSKKSQFYLSEGLIDH
jgi:hypothetical protein